MRDPRERGPLFTTRLFLRVFIWICVTCGVGLIAAIVSASSWLQDHVGLALLLGGIVSYLVSVVCACVLQSYLHENGLSKHSPLLIAFVTVILSPVIGLAVMWWVSLAADKAIGTSPPVAYGSAALETAPTSVPERLRSPGRPPCWLRFSVKGASVSARFDASFVLDVFVKAFAKYLRDQFNVQIGVPGRNGDVAVDVQVVEIDAGSRILRYVLPLLAGKATVKIEGSVVQSTGCERPFYLEQSKEWGFFGGRSRRLLAACARKLAIEVAWLCR